MLILNDNDHGSWLLILPYLNIIGPRVFLSFLHIFLSWVCYWWRCDEIRARVWLLKNNERTCWTYRMFVPLFVLKVFAMMPWPIKMKSLQWIAAVSTYFFFEIFHWNTHHDSRKHNCERERTKKKMEELQLHFNIVFSSTCLTSLEMKNGRGKLKRKKNEAELLYKRYTNDSQQWSAIIISQAWFIKFYSQPSSCAVVHPLGCIWMLNRRERKKNQQTNIIMSILSNTISFKYNS